LYRRKISPEVRIPLSPQARGAQQNKYRHVIERIDQESLSGKFFYPKVLEEIKAIKNL
jgi:hypothetical protein